MVYLIYIYPYWKGKTTSELATANMAPEALAAIDHNIFTPGNYFYNGIGHVTVDYGKVLKIGYKGIAKEAKEALGKLKVSDEDYASRSQFLEAVLISCDAVCKYAERYVTLAKEEAAACSDENRKAELLKIAENCSQVPANGARSFYEACQSFWFVQMLLQTESSGHSISPGRFDQYMYPYFEADLDKGVITREFAQELIDCIWVKLNDLNKVRDAASAEGFAGYSLFQNLIAGGQDKAIKLENDANNNLIFDTDMDRNVFIRNKQAIPYGSFATVKIKVDSLDAWQLFAGIAFENAVNGLSNNDLYSLILSKNSLGNYSMEMQKYKKDVGQTEFLTLDNNGIKFTLKPAILSRGF